MVKKKNRNIVLIKSITELKKETNYADFQYKKYFIHLCNLIPNKKAEKLEIEKVNSQNIENSGLVYVFVINKKIFKIGQTITTIAKRIQSYNCGKTEYRIAGTNSTTNYFVLQSLLNINKTINVYAFFPETPEYTIFGKKYQSSYPPTKTAEHKILEDFISKFGQKPIGCTQS